MGRATRWFKGLLGMKKDKVDNIQVDSSNTTPLNDRKEKKRWSFGKSARTTGTVGHVSTNIPPNINPSDAAWLRSYLADSEKEQNKHAIAVAAATAAAADAAVAAAQAAVAVVRLTSQSGGLMCGKRDRWAAVKIQTVFRGYLARKALRALKGLVKLQALVRGFLVRKRTAATLHSMQALIRAQTAVRSQRARRSFNKENRLLPEIHARKSIERFDETRSEFHSKRLSTSYEASFNGFDESPKIVEIDTYKPRSRSRRYSTALSECDEDLPYQTISSPLPCPVPARISVPDCRHVQDYEWYFNSNETKFSTAHSTPKFSNSFWSNSPTTPAKSVCGDSFFRPYSNFPNYMANTQSFKAKLRSYSAPKQRPESAHKKRLSLNEIMAARNSISSVRMHRSTYSQVQEEALNY
ncbi:hypothetical protein FEM48_Zijuj01G0285800 [Ziziphus jujuba var. spinosa]|uniref:DUF4005 domain-containing protein n=1 Tax=Ziziphus jujuba var. spinosa TaxID=714518 RepID=A0A978W5I0_ZIZJJ|nr:hypothetical protein FEM48_Zijuj01G0285800 [Ziziphus jujuba var. spinosa]